MTKWIYLSPHLDDAVYSCGGLIHQQGQQGMQVEIWTVFAGHFEAGSLSPFAKAIHERWGTGEQSVNARREEDARACALLGAAPVHFHFQDVIYRSNPLSGQAEIINNEDLFRACLPSDAQLQQQIAAALEDELSWQKDVQVCIPLGLGKHIDHTLVRKAAEALHMSLPLAYYADFPYVLDDEIEGTLPGQRTFVLSPSNITAWCEAVILYGSQASTFWKDEDELRQQIFAYWNKAGGSSLWFADQ
jgi:LmbE family N-acetylglucosaminyl deacetylase